ncbi:MAG: halocyanin domain-containing protein, partial [Acidimicrobiales bacterium]
GATRAVSDGRDGAAVYPAAALSGRGGESPLGGVAGGVAGSVAGDGSPVEELVATTRGGGGGGDA